MICAKLFLPFSMIFLELVLPFSMVFPYFSHSNLHFSSHRHLEACCKKAAASAPAAAERAARAAGSSWGGQKDGFSPWKSPVLDLGWGFDDDLLGSLIIFPDDLGWLKWRSGFVDELGCFRMFEDVLGSITTTFLDEVKIRMMNYSRIWSPWVSFRTTFWGVAVTCGNLQIQHDLWWTLWFMRCRTLFWWRAVYIGLSSCCFLCTTRTQKAQCQ